MKNLLQWTAAFAAVSLVSSSGARAQTAGFLESDASRGQTILVDAQGVRSISRDAGGRSTKGRAANGPAGTGVWRDIGPYGGSVTAIGLSPVDPDLILAATQGAAEYEGFFRSTDGGETWAHAPVLGAERISAIVFTPDGTAFAGVRVGGLWQSTDGGLGWTFLDLTPPNWISTLAVHPTNGAEIWAGVRASAASLYRSEDGGDTWQSVGPPIGPFEGCSRVAFDATSSDKVYAVCGLGQQVWVSTDGGASWSDRTAGLPTMNLEDLAHDGSRILVGGSSGLFASSDDGLTWSALHDGTWPSRWTLAVAVDPGAPSILYAGSTLSSGVHRSTDGGASWEIAIAGTEKLTVNAIEFAPQDPSRILLGANALGVFQSEDSGPGFRRTSQGMTSMRVYSVAVDPQDPSNLAAAFEGHNGGGVFVSTDRGASWILEDSLPPGRFAYVAFSSQGVLHAVHDGPTVGGVDEGVYRRGAGGTWEWLGPDQGEAHETELAVLRFSELAPDLIVAGGNDSFVVGREATIWLSLDAGANWSKVHEGIVEREVVRELEILDNGTVNDMVAVFDNPFEDLAGGVLRSTDGGSNWFPSDAGLPSDFRGRALCAVTGAPQSLFAAHRDEELPPQTGALFESNDGGASWTAVGYQGTFMDLVCDPDDPGVLYGAFAEDHLVRRSEDHGQSFSAFDAGLEMAGNESLNSAGDGVRILHNQDPLRPQLYLSSATGVWVTDLNADIFADGFESGDLDAWTSSQP